ncbi:MAG: lamin tail domain-containing protein [Fidelibacterota bacterium]
MKKTPVLLMTFIPLLMQAAPDHLIFSEIVITPGDGEYIQIKNPTSQNVDMSNYYLTDAVDTVNGKFYYNLPSGSNYHSGSATDFTARFPDGFILTAGSSITVAVDSAKFNNYYSEKADLSIKNNFRQAVDGTNSIGGAPVYLDDIQESLILFYWDGTAATVKDVDYLVWGSRLHCVDKSDVSGYNDDTPISQQEYVEAHVVDEKFQRINGEGSEIASGGNGITGHDETSEHFTETWQIVAVANTKPQLDQPYYSPQNPTSDDEITFYCNITDDSAVDTVMLFYKLDGDWLTAKMSLVGSIYEVTIGPLNSAGVLTYYIRAVDDTGLENSTNIGQITVAEPQPELTIQTIRDNWDEWEGETVTLTGVVSIGAGILRNDRTSAYMQDQSGSGLNLFDYNLTDLTRGDSIEITGTLEEYGGIIELTGWSSNYTVIAVSRPIPGVVTVPIAALNSAPTDYEGTYLTINGTVAERADNIGGGSNIIIEDVTGRTTVRIWNSANVLVNSLREIVNDELDSLLTTGNMVEIRGVVSLYNSEAQILLGYAEDVQPWIPGEPGQERTKLTVAPYPFVPKLGEVIHYSYEYPSNSRVILRVYDMAGRFVISLEDDYFALSWKKENTWDGRNELNELVSPGTYIFHLESTNRTTGKSAYDIAPVVIGVKF